MVDATNLTAAARRALVTRAAAAGIPAVAIVLDLPERRRPGTQRVAGGIGSCPRRSCDGTWREVRRIVADGALTAEGFVSVIRLTDPDEVDRVVVSRVEP